MTTPPTTTEPQLDFQRIGEAETMRLYEVIILRDHPTEKNAKQEHSEYYVAGDIRTVWNALNNELSDSSVEVKTIHRSVPILAILKQQ